MCIPRARMERREQIAASVAHTHEDERAVENDMHQRRRTATRNTLAARMRLTKATRLGCRSISSGLKPVTSPVLKNRPPLIGHRNR